MIHYTCLTKCKGTVRHAPTSIVNEYYIQQVIAVGLLMIRGIWYWISRILFLVPSYLYIRIQMEGLTHAKESSHIGNHFIQLSQDCQHQSLSDRIKHIMQLL